MRYAPLVGAFTPASIEEFLGDVLAGRVRTVPIAAVPSLGAADPSVLSDYGADEMPAEDDSSSSNSELKEEL
jgi:hypothetical protein